MSAIIAVGLLSSCDPGAPPADSSASTPTPDAQNPVAAQTTAENPLNVPPVVQEAMMSCWAACGEMIMRYVRQQSLEWRSVPAPRQCQQATNEYPQDCAGCCDDQLNMLCSKSGEPQFEAAWNFSCQPRNRHALSWGEVTTEIDGNRPVAFSWKKDGGGEHLEVLIGYDSNADGQWITYLDPVFRELADVAVVPFSEYCCSTVSEHVNDFYQIQVSGRPAQ